jgi:glutamate-1-semialdehyde 2,1-aminomutase
MSAIRLARGFTKRNIVVKFEGCYHGHADSLLVKAGSGALTFGNPTSSGVPPEAVKHTMVLHFNDIAGVRAAFAEHGKSIACVIVEPIAGNMNLVPPIPGFLEALRDCCTASGSVLIFDEVMTGFRVAFGGAQALFGVQPDLTTLGKVIGGGLPVGAFGGRAEIMSCLAPLGGVYQAGTLSGNPLAVTAGLATLAKVRASGFYTHLESRCKSMVNGVVEVGRKRGFNVSGIAIGGMFGIYFASLPPQSYAEVMAMDKSLFNRFFHAMLDRGVYFAPSVYEAGFISAAHSEQDVEFTIDCAAAAFESIRAN